MTHSRSLVFFDSKKKVIDIFRKKMTLPDKNLQSKSKWRLELCPEDIYHAEKPNYKSGVAGKERIRKKLEDDRWLGRMEEDTIAEAETLGKRLVGRPDSHQLPPPHHGLVR